MPTPLPQNQVVDASQALSLLAPIFFGSGKTTTTDASVSSKAGLSQEQSVFNTATGNANNTDITNAIVQNIMNQAAIAFAPTVGQQNSAGMYNSNVLQMLSAMAQGQATSQSAQAVLNYKTSQQQIALNASNQLLATNKQTSGTKQTAPIISPSMLLQGGAGLVANKVLGPQLDKALNAVGLGPSTSTGATGVQLAGGAGKAGEAATGLSPSTAFPASTDSVIAPSAIPSVGSSVLDTSGAIVESGLPDGALNAAGSGAIGSIDSAGGVATDALSSLGSASTDTIASAASGIIDTSALDAAASTGILDIGAGAAGTAVDAAGIAGADLLGGVGADVAGSVAADLGVGAGVDLAAFGGIGADIGIGAGVDLAAFGGIGADVAGTAVAADAGFGLADLAIGLLAWIICTELVRQGRMSKKWYVTGSKKFASYPEIGKNGYYVWAIPCVRHLRKHPDSWFSYFLERIFNWRAEYIASTYGVRGARKLWKGRIVSAVLYPSCWILGHILWPFKRFDYTSVYNKESA